MIGAGGGLLGYELVRSRPEARDPALAQTAALDAAAAQLDREIAEVWTRVQRQAKLIAGQQIVRGIVVTDQASAADALQAIDIELTRPGEIVQIGQRAGTFHMKLFMEPATVAGAYPAPRDGSPGSYHELIADRLWISESAEVHPRKMRDANGVETAYTAKNGQPIVGYAMVSRSLALEPVLSRLATTLASGQLELAGEQRAFGPPARTSTLTKPLLALPDARIVAAVPAAVPAGYAKRNLVGGAVIGGLGVVLVIAGLALRRPKPPKVERPVQRSTPLPRTLIQSLIETDTQFPSELDKTSVDSLPAGFDDTLASAQPIPRPSGTPFQPTQAPSESGTIHPQQIRPGTSIGRWQIVRQLGGGGMAEVYLAQAHGEGGFEKQVAIKVMHPHLARDERTIAHFLDEARLAAGITHQNVVAIQDLGRIGDDYFIVMEYIDGLDLEHLLASARAAGRPIPLNVGLGLLRRICDGLTAAHQAKSPDGQPLDIIHRDVKSANVLVSRQGAVKVVDFGIAKATAQLHNSFVGETKGTPAMMAPEQRVGSDIDIRVDVYSVGALAYEILTGQPVNVDFVALAHLGVENWPHLPPPSAVRPTLPAELDGIVFGAMAFDRDRRPASCEELESQLERVMHAHQLAASDKDIARWVLDELRLLIPTTQLLARTTRPVTHD